MFVDIVKASMGMALCVALGACDGAMAGGTCDTALGEGSSGEVQETEAGDEGGGTEEQGAELSPEELAEIAAVEGELLEIVAGAVAAFESSGEGGLSPRCPHPNGWSGSGSAGHTPDLEFQCSPGGCVPIDTGGGEPRLYSNELWTQNSVWQALGWQRELDVPHSFHYDFRMTNFSVWTAACEFTAIARADFDGDNRFSTYSISGYVDEEVVEIEPMVVKLPFE